MSATNWPDPIRPEAFYGLAGDFVRLVEEHTEADPVGLLLTFLAAAGSAIGNAPSIDVSGFVSPVVLAMFCACQSCTPVSADCSSGASTTIWRPSGICIA